MGHLRSLPLLVTLPLLATLPFLACVGDPIVPPVLDAGKDSASTADAAPDAFDASPATCAGQAFGPLKKIDFFPPDASGWGGVWSPRAVGNTLYWAGSIAPNTLDIYTGLLNGTNVVNGGTVLSSTVMVGPSSSSTLDWSPAIASSTSYIVFARGNVLARDLFVGSGLSWGTVAAAAALNTADDDTDPWIVGAPPVALYYARNTPTSGKILRARITSTTPTFGAPTDVTLPCPSQFCGTPVVDAAESTLLFAAWADAKFATTVYEIALSKVATDVTAKGTPVPHPELGTHYPSWVSSDGCVAIVAHGEPGEVWSATRSPK